LVSGFEVVNSFRHRSGGRIARWEVVFGFSNPGNRLIKVTMDKAFAASICCVSRSNFAVMANVVARVGRSVFSPGDFPNCYPSMQPRIRCLLARGLSISTDDPIFLWDSRPVSNSFLFGAGGRSLLCISNFRFIRNVP